MILATAVQGDLVKKSSDSSEGLVVAWAMVIIIICTVGSMSTGVGIVEFFFFGVAAILMASIVLFLIVGFFMVFVHTWVKARKDDDRPLFDFLREEYSFRRLAADYGVLVKGLYESVQDWRSKSDDGHDKKPKQE